MRFKLIKRFALPKCGFSFNGIGFFIELELLLPVRINKENENRLRAKKLLADKKRDRKGY